MAGFNAPSVAILNPNFTIPELILPYSQASGAFWTLEHGEPMIRLGDGDLVVYAKRLDIRTPVAAAQNSYETLPSVSTTMSLLSTTTYQTRVRAEYNHHDTSAAGKWGVSIVATNRLGGRQGHYQFARNALLYGVNPAASEGLVNATGTTAVVLPPDSNGNTTLATYDPGQLAIFFLAQIVAIKTATNQMGTGRAITILGPQEVLGPMEYVDVVQLTSFQRNGAGVATSGGMIKDIAERNEDEITWAYDDTLKGQGQGGTDLVIFVMTDVEVTDVNKINTNEVAKLSPGLEATTLQLCDKAAPTEIPVPIPGGAIDIVSEWRITPGWAVRPEAVRLVSIQPS